MPRIPGHCYAFLFHALLMMLFFMLLGSGVLSAGALALLLHRPLIVGRWLLPLWPWRGLEIMLLLLHGLLTLLLCRLFALLLRRLLRRLFTLLLHWLLTLLRRVSRLALTTIGIPRPLPVLVIPGITLSLSLLHFLPESGRPVGSNICCRLRRSHRMGCLHHICRARFFPRIPDYRRAVHA